MIHCDQTTQTMDPKKLESSRGAHARKGEGIKPGQAGGDPTTHLTDYPASEQNSDGLVTGETTPRPGLLLRRFLALCFHFYFINVWRAKCGDQRNLCGVVSVSTFMWVPGVRFSSSAFQIKPFISHLLCLEPSPTTNWE